MKLALIGKANSGQYYAARHMNQVHDFKRVKFIDGARRLVLRLYGSKNYHEVTPATQRKFYDALYSVDPEIWWMYMKHRLHRITKDVIVEDPRYLNEVEHLRDEGFIFIRLTTSNRGKHFWGKPEFPNSVMLDEAFKSDLNVDYSIYWETRPQLYVAMDELYEKILNSTV